MSAECEDHVVDLAMSRRVREALARGVAEDPEIPDELNAWDAFAGVVEFVGRTIEYWELVGANSRDVLFGMFVEHLAELLDESGGVHVAELRE